MLDAVPDLEVLIAGPGRHRRGTRGDARRASRALRPIPRTDQRRGQGAGPAIRRRLRRSAHRRRVVRHRAGRGDGRAGGGAGLRSARPSGGCWRTAGAAGCSRTRAPSGLADGPDRTAGRPRAARRPTWTQADRRVRDFDWDKVVDNVIAVYDSVHMPGEKVTEDLRGQLVGRLGAEGRGLVNGWLVAGRARLVVVLARRLLPQHDGRPARPPAPADRHVDAGPRRPTAATVVRGPGAGLVRTARSRGEPAARGGGARGPHVVRPGRRRSCAGRVGPDGGPGRRPRSRRRGRGRCVLAGAGRCSTSSTPPASASS